VRVFLSEIDNLEVAETILVTVLLVADAFRFGAPPVILGLQFLADRCCLRIEVDDQQPFSPSSRPSGYRGELLDGHTSKRGLEPCAYGGTRSWVELPVIPSMWEFCRA
jgi:hypothetical protein